MDEMFRFKRFKFEKPFWSWYDDLHIWTRDRSNLMTSSWKLNYQQCDQMLEYKAAQIYPEVDQKVAKT